MDSLGKLFGSLGRVKVIRLFVFNRHEGFTADAVAERTRLSLASTRAELVALVAIGVLQKTGKTPMYRVNMRYPHFEPLATFIRSTTTISPEHLLELLRRAGNLRLVVLSGVFTGATDADIDLLVVGDKLEEKALARAVHVIEAELGREIRYASFSTEDFSYRLGIYDRLIRDVFDYPHQAILDRIGL
jgi:predicted nucleotidyltransferase